MAWSKDGKGGSVISFKGRTRASAIARRGPLRRTEKHVEIKIRTSALNRILTKYPGIKNMTELMIKIRDEAVANNDKDSIKDELGDVFFSLVNLGRFLDVSGEDALRMTISKFENRFAKVEEELKMRGSSMEDSNLDEMDEIWNDIKKGE